MTTNARVGVGATLGLGNSASPTVYTNVAEITNISGPEISVEQVEASTLDSTGGYKEFIPGLKDGGSVSFTMNWTNKASQQSIRNLIGGTSNSKFLITLPTSPLSRFRFEGIVESMSWSAEPNAPMTSDVTIKISGAVAFT